MGASCELTIRLGTFFEGVGCGTYGTFLLTAIVFGILGLAALRLRLKWLSLMTQREKISSLRSRVEEPKRLRDSPENRF
jgi:hypothetical protein